MHGYKRETEKSINGLVKWHPTRWILLDYQKNKHTMHIYLFFIYIKTSYLTTRFFTVFFKANQLTTAVVWSIEIKKETTTFIGRHFFPHIVLSIDIREREVPIDFSIYINIIYIILIDYCSKMSFFHRLFKFRIFVCYISL